MSLPASIQLTPSQQVYLQKQQEHAGLQALREASGSLVERVEKLAEMSNTMADGGEAIGAVLRNWPHVFAVLNLFGQSSYGEVRTASDPADKPPAGSTSLASANPQEDEEDDEPLPQLVRLPYTSESKTEVAKQ